MNAVDGLKVCARCRESKAVTDFHVRRQTADGRCLYCKRCKSSIDVEKRNKRMAQMTLREIASMKEAQRSVQYRHKYGITVVDYDDMYASRNGICDVCGKPDKATETGDNSRTRSPKHLMVDHDHVTGRVRGLIHHTCNIMLGIFQDSPEIIKRAVDYLEHHDE